MSDDVSLCPLDDLYPAVHHEAQGEVLCVHWSVRPLLLQCCFIQFDLVGWSACVCVSVRVTGLSVWDTVCVYVWVCSFTQFYLVDGVCSSVCMYDGDFGSPFRLVKYSVTYKHHDPFLSSCLPSSPWITDDVTLWALNMAKYMRH